MIPLFIFVTEYMSGDKRLINFQHVQQITSLKEHEGSVLYLGEGKKLLVKETLDKLNDVIKLESVDIRYKCYKRIAEEKELL